MSENTNTVITFEGGGPDDDGTGLIGTGEGSISLEQDEAAPGESDCVGGEMVVGIRVYVSPEDLNYTISTTRGSITPEGVVTDAEESETVDFDLSTEEESRASFTSPPEVSWEGGCINEAGEVVACPEVSFTAPNIFTTASKIYGSLRVGGSTRYILHTLTLPPRGEGDTATNDSDDAWSAKVVALWDGGLVDIEVTAPSDADSGCPGGDNVIIDPDGDDDQCYKILRFIDPCTGEQTKDDEIVPMVCPAEAEEE